jgi:hypothetical protein
VYKARPAARFKYGAAAGDSECSQGKIYGGSEAGIHERTETQDLKPGSPSSWSRAEVLNWPNAISLARLLSGPLLVGSAINHPLPLLASSLECQHSSGLFLINRKQNPTIPLLVYPDLVQQLQALTF